MNSESVSISVVLCTHNRANLLDGALESLANQNIGLNEFEIIVVDNCSTDDTAALTRKWMASLSNLRYVYEPIVGLSVARNRGMREAKSELIAYLDDDAVASPSWLTSLLKGFADFRAPACVGGPVFLTWEGGKPEWIPNELLSVFAYMDYGDQVQAVIHVNGCNMAFRRDILDRYDGFETRLGFCGKNLLSQEESHLQWQLRHNGHPILYHPGAVVHHRIIRHKQSRTYLHEWFYSLGRSTSVRYEIGRLSGDWISPAKRIVKRSLIAALLLPKYIIYQIGSLGSTGRARQLLIVQCSLFEAVGFVRHHLGVLCRAFGEYRCNRREEQEPAESTGRSAGPVTESHGGKDGRNPGSV